MNDNLEAALASKMTDDAKKLQKRLLKHGGDRIDPRLAADPHLAELLKMGRLFPDLEVKKVKGRANQCHQDSALLYCEDPESYTICTGYGLRQDGFWGMHSWVMYCGTSVRHYLILETTHGNYLKHYGIHLDAKAACYFVMANVVKELPGWADCTAGLNHEPTRPNVTGA